MRILVATDAWRPQVNGVVRTLGSLARAAASSASRSNSCRRKDFHRFRCRPIPGLRLALPSRREIAERIERQAPTPSISPPKDRSALPCACLLPAQRQAVHDELHDAISGIHFGPLADSGRLDLCGLALVPLRCGRDHGGDAVADGGTWPARILQSRACGPAGSTSSCSAPPAPSISTFRARSS